MNPQNYVTENLPINIVNSILDNLKDKKYLLNRYADLRNTIDWLVKNKDLSILQNRQYLYTYLDESNLLYTAIFKLQDHD